MWNRVQRTYNVRRIYNIEKHPPEVFYKKKVVLKISQNSQENTCARVSFLIKTKTLAQVFPCEFCEILKNAFCTEHLLETASQY